VSSEERILDQLAEAILAGSPVDWDAAKASAGGAARPLLPHLEVLAAIADVHRRTPEPAGSAVDSVSETLRLSGEPAAVDGLQTWGSLRLLAKIGEGSFGEVYRAWDTRLDREVALKLLRRADSAVDDVASMVVEEGRMLARVRHPHVATVHGADCIGGRVGLWMELVEGRTLEQVLREQGPFGVQEATVIGLDLCRALSAVHRAGLVHRDVKAHNVMREAGGRIVLMDFGTGRRAEGDGEPRHLAGTPLYLAPEVLEGEAASVRSDLYALGVLLFHLVTGGYPVAGESLHEIRDRHRRGERVLLRDARPDAPERFVRVIERALSPSPRERPESAGAMEAELLAVLGSASPTASGTGSGAPDLVAERAAPATANDVAGARRRRRARTSAVAAGGAAIAVALAAGLGFVLGRRAAPPSAAPAAAVSRLHRLTDFAGLEEFPALSPDGKSVAFTAYAGGKRQIFVRLLAGGPPLQVTRDAADHQLPRWAPDSSSIVYYTPPAAGEEQGTLHEISALGGAPRRVLDSVGGADVSLEDGRLACFRLAGGRLELVSAPRDGSPPRVVSRFTPGSYFLYPRWSPDGRWIAFQRGDGVRFDVFVVAAAGGEPRRWTRDQTLQAGFTWLPDSSGIVLSSSRASTVPYLPTFNLWEARLGDERLRELTSGESSLVHPDLAASGAMVAGRMRMQLDLWQYPVDGPPRDNVRAGRPLTRQTGYVQTPTAGPGDREVAFLSDSGGRTNLWVLARDTGELRQITYDRDAAISIGVPLWSPDGGSIAFVSSRGNQGLVFGIWLVDPDGSHLRRLVSRGLGAAWSPDGRWVYYVDPAARQLRKVPAAGGATVTVRSEPARNVIGRHGSTLYYTVERPLVDGRPEFEIRAATPEDGPSRLLARIPAARVASWQIVNPALSPDGAWLAQPLTDDLTTNIWALSTATGRWRQITDFGDRSTFIARRVSWSADGRRVLAAVGDGDADVVLLEDVVSVARR
jgi:serine/threonine-protein kinase